MNSSLPSPPNPFANIYYVWMYSWVGFTYLLEYFISSQVAVSIKTGINTQYQIKPLTIFGYIQYYLIQLIGNPVTFDILKINSTQYQLNFRFYGIKVPDFIAHVILEPAVPNNFNILKINIYRFYLLNPIHCSGVNVGLTNYV